MVITIVGVDCLYPCLIVPVIYTTLVSDNKPPDRTYDTTYLQTTVDSMPLDLTVGFLQPTDGLPADTSRLPSAPLLPDTLLYALFSSLPATPFLLCGCCRSPTNAPGSVLVYCIPFCRVPPLPSPYLPPTLFCFWFLYLPWPPYTITWLDNCVLL